MAGLVLKEVSKAFNGTPVLENISLELAEGELLVLLGPSGCGKSTLLRIIAGLEEADHGEIFINGRRVDRLLPRERDVALVFQNYSLYPHMTVAKNLAFPLRVAKKTRAEITERVQEVAALLGLDDRLKDRPGQLSGGQRQRVALGRAIIREPSLFLLDEPLSNLDAELRVRMRREIVALQRRLNKTTVHVTHDQSEALTMADRIALLNGGRLEQLGTPEDLYERPSGRFAAEFIGSPKINMIEAVITENRIAPFGTVCPRPVAQQLPVGSLLVGLRPEHVDLSGGEYTATVTASEYLGDRCVLHLEFQSQRLTALQPPERTVEPGQAVRFAIDPKRLLYFDPASGRRLEAGE